MKYPVLIIVVLTFVVAFIRPPPPLLIVIISLPLFISLRRDVSARVHGELLPDDHPLDRRHPASGGALGPLHDEAPLREHAPLVQHPPGLAQPPHQHPLPPADVDGDGPPRDGPEGLVPHQEPEHPHGRLVVAVHSPAVVRPPPPLLLLLLPPPLVVVVVVVVAAVVLGLLERGEHGLDVQGEGVQGGEGAGGGEEERGVGAGGVHVELEDLQAAQAAGQQGQVGGGHGGAAAVLLVEAGVVAQAEGGEGGGVREQRVDGGEGVGVHRHLEGGEGPHVRPDQHVQPPRGLGAGVGRRVVRAEVLAAEGPEVGQVAEVDGAEEVVDGDRDELQAGDAGEVPVAGDLLRGVPPVVGLQAQLAEGREALVRRELELRPLAAVLEAQHLQPPGGDEEVLERVQPRHQRRRRVGRLQGDEQADRDGAGVYVAQLALEVPEGELLYVQPRVVEASLLHVEDVGWHPELFRVDFPIYVSPSTGS